MNTQPRYVLFKVSSKHLSQHAWCTSQMDLALEMKFYVDFHPVTTDMTTDTCNGSDVKCIFPRCPCVGVWPVQDFRWSVAMSSLLTLRRRQKCPFASFFCFLVALSYQYCPWRPNRVNDDDDDESRGRPDVALCSLNPPPRMRASRLKPDEARFPLIVQISAVIFKVLRIKFHFRLPTSRSQRPSRGCLWEIFCSQCSVSWCELRQNPTFLLYAIYSPWSLESPASLLSLFVTYVPLILFSFFLADTLCCKESRRTSVH